MLRVTRSRTESRVVVRLSALIRKARCRPRPCVFLARNAPSMMRSLLTAAVAAWIALAAPYAAAADLVFAVTEGITY